MEKSLEIRHKFQVGMSSLPHGLLHRRRVRMGPSRCRVKGNLLPTGAEGRLPENKWNLGVIILSIGGKSEKETQAVLVDSFGL